MFPVLRSAPGATTLIAHTPARLMAIMALTGSLAASSSAPAHGLAAGMAVRGAGDGAIPGAAGDGVHMPTMAIVAATVIAAATDTRVDTAEVMVAATAAEPMAERAASAQAVIAA